MVIFRGDETVAFVSECFGSKAARPENNEARAFAHLKYETKVQCESKQHKTTMMGRRSGNGKLIMECSTALGLKAARAEYIEAGAFRTSWVLEENAK